MVSCGGWRAAKCRASRPVAAQGQPSRRAHRHAFRCLAMGERVKGIEPSSSAWKAVALPLSYTRKINNLVYLCSFIWQEFSRNGDKIVDVVVLHPFQAKDVPEVFEIVNCERRAE
jgi:hypothetical protein